MKRVATMACTAIACALALSTALSAKGRTTRIVIRGAGLASVEITDESVLRRFNVWAGAGTFVNDKEQREGFIVDWASGPVREPPPSTPRYEVRFYVPGAQGEELLAYVVLYAPDADPRGAVHFPGRRKEWYDLNVRTIWRGPGVDGKWFRVSAAWHEVTRRLLDAARTSADPDSAP